MIFPLCISWEPSRDWTKCEKR